MTDQQILEKAIQNAIDGGWNAEMLGGADTWQEELSELERKHVIKVMFYQDDMVPQPFSILIFNHDFAKALWGDYLVNVKNGCADTDFAEENALSPYWRRHHLYSWNYDMPVWAIHLSKMVIADDPIKYLGDHL